MKQSQLFTKTKKESPSDEVALNAELLIKGGFINKEMAGVYSYLPLGLRVINKIVEIIREEMNAIGGQEIAMTALQDKSLWEKTDRWNDENVDVWFKTKLKNDAEVGLGWTHEEQVTMIAKNFIQSYRDLPFSTYQFQTKFRNETRAKSGIMRTREFIMKDLYSFSRDEAEHLVFYERAKEAYKKIFQRAGIGHLTYFTAASGGAFSKFSHEFQTISGAGEDIIYIPKDNNNTAINKEIFTPDLCKDLGISGDFDEHRSIEVGNIFTLADRFSKPLGLTFKTEDGVEQNVFMGCYGIGPGRLMGTIVEVLSDDKGIIWPEEVAPFTVHVLALGEDENVIQEANSLYENLSAQGIEVLFDDRSGVNAGEKFADSDLIGIPYRVVVSKRSLADGGYELKKRVEQSGKIVTEEELLSYVR